jgi:hypothetical protein
MRILHDKYAWLESILAKPAPLPTPKERQQVYARRFRRRRSSDIPKLPRHRQELEAVCFATVTLGTLADDLLRLVEMRIASIWNWAHRIAAEQVTPARVRRRGEILAQLRQLVQDASLDDAAYRSRSAALLLPTSDAAAPSRAADVREVLSRNARRVRPLLELLIKLDLQGDAQHPIKIALEWIKFYHKEKIDWLYPEPPREWVGRWRTPIDGQDLERGLRAYEAAALWGVRRALRNGSLWSPYGYDFSNPAQNFPRVASLKLLPARGVASPKMLPAIAVAPWLLHNLGGRHGKQDDAHGAGGTDPRSPSPILRCDRRREAQDPR